MDEMLSSTRDGESAPSRLPRGRAFWLVAGFVLAGILCGLGLAFTVWKVRPSANAGRKNAPAVVDGAAMQRAALEARVWEWRKEMGADTGGSVDPDAEALLDPLEVALVKVETDRMRLDAEASDKADKAASYDDLEHREELLRLSYDGELGRLTPEQRRAAQTGLLQREIAGAQAFLGTLGPAPAPAAAKSGESPRGAATQTVAGAAGGLAGGLLGAGVVLWMGRRRRTPEAADDGGAVAVAEVEVAELGSIPRASALDGAEDSPVAMAAQEIGHAMLAEDLGKGVRSYAVTGESTAPVTAQVGLALSRIGLRVVLVGAGGDGLHEMFAVENEFGLGEWLNGKMDAETAPLTMVVHTTRFAGLGVVPRGHGEIVCERMKALLGRLVKEWDLVLVDAPELHGWFEGGVVLVVRGGDGQYERGGAALRRLMDDGLKVTGVVVS